MPRNQAAEFLNQLLKENEGQTLTAWLLQFFLCLSSRSSMTSKVTKDVDKTTMRSVGKLQFSIAIDGGESHTGAPDMTVALVLGTPHTKTLLAHRSVRFHRSSSKKEGRTPVCL
jgi:hypothetical protein